MADTATGTRTRYRNPSWWDRDYDSAWERTKEAFRRDWEQTKHDFGGDEPDLDQDVDDTVGQSFGTRPIPPPGHPNPEGDYSYDNDYDNNEPGYRFGWGARRRYGNDYTEWNDDLETRLRGDWESTYPDSDYSWDRYRSSVRRGWDYRE